MSAKMVLGRHLTPTLKAALLDGDLKPLLEAAQRDPDMLLELRGDYFNLYFRGYSIAKVAEKSGGCYAVTIAPEFTKGLPSVPKAICSRSDAVALAELLPMLKENVLRYRADKGANEIEVEQLLVRFNGCEPKINTDYIMVDRQVALPGLAQRLDLLGLHWPATGRHGEQTVELALIEVKFALNLNTVALAKQLDAYVTAVENNFTTVADEVKLMLRDKLDLGLIRATPGREAALRSLRIEGLCVVITLIDASPYSKQLDLNPLRDLARKWKCIPFRLMHLGFGAWDDRSTRL